MKSTLYLLHLENDPNAAALVESMLECITCTTACVQSRGAFMATVIGGDMTHIGTVVKAPPTFGHDARRAKNREGSNI
jgi:hypothetical protein